MKDKVNDDVFDLNELLHPSAAFEHPSEVIGDPDLTVQEKRAILVSWASDACALEAAPDLRELPRGRLVRFDDIIDALRSLDDSEREPIKAYRKQVRRRAIFNRNRRSENTGSSAQ